MLVISVIFIHSHSFKLFIDPYDFEDSKSHMHQIKNSIRVFFTSKHIAIIAFSKVLFHNHTPAIQNHHQIPHCKHH